jgi:hypothetical protein
VEPFLLKIRTEGKEAAVVERGELPPELEAKAR